MTELSKCDLKEGMEVFLKNESINPVRVADLEGRICKHPTNQEDLIFEGFFMNDGKRQYVRWLVGGCTGTFYKK